MTGTLFGFGRRLNSELPIPGAVFACLDDAGAPPLTITLAQPAPPTPGAPRFVRDGDTVVYEHPSGFFSCTQASVTVTPKENADLLDLSALLIANALPASLWLDGAYMLHAAGLSMPGHTHGFAIAGPSGSGKTALAAQLLAQGIELMADDSMAVRFADGIPVASGLPGGYFTGPPDRPGRRFHSLPCAAACRQARLATVFILEHRDGAPAITRQTQLAALEHLLRHRHRPQVPDLLGRHAAILDQARQLTETLAVYVWHRPHGSPDLSTTERVMIDHCLKEASTA